MKIFLQIFRLCLNNIYEKSRSSTMPAFLQTILFTFNTLAAGLNQAVRKKQLIRTWLCG